VGARWFFRNPEAGSLADHVAAAIIIFRKIPMEVNIIYGLVPSKV
jgi:hypothetical protein